MTVDSTNDASRCDAISHCMDELAGIRLARPERKEWPVLAAIMLGELDWLEELHRLLYQHGN